MTAIEWTDETWNPVVGCTKVSPGCKHCYAETMAKRLRAMALADFAAGRDPGRKRAYIDAVDERGRWTGKLVPVPEALTDPMRWRKPRRVFVNSMSDLFHESVPDAFIDRVFGAMAKAFWHTYQVLTKRADRMAAYLNAPGVQTRILEQARQFDWPDWAMRAVTRDGSGYPGWPIKNVWLGVSVEDQQRADERIPLLLATPAAVRFLSCEPLLGPVDLRLRRHPSPLCRDCADAQVHGICDTDGKRCDTPDWVIVGGESGPGARKCDYDWIASIVEQCKAASVPAFVKQLGSNHWSDDPVGEFPPMRIEFRHQKGGDPAEWPENLRVREFPKQIGGSRS